MPREDERYRNLSPTHPQYCTCVECVERRMQGGSDTVAGKVGGLVGKLAGKAGKAAKAGKIGKGKKRGKSGASGKARGKSQSIAEPVKKHKADCECATCTLLRSV